MKPAPTPNATSGVSAHLLRWRGDYDFTSARNVTLWPRWQDEFIPSNWCCDPGEVELVWRIVQSSDRHQDYPDSWPGLTWGATGRAYAYGVIRSGTLYRVRQWLDSTEYLNSNDDNNLGFDILGSGVDGWYFKGTLQNQVDGVGGAVGSVQLEWVVELATVRFSDPDTVLLLPGSCGEATFRDVGYTEGPGVSGAPNAWTTTAPLRSVARWTGDSVDADIARNATGAIYYGGNGLTADSTDFGNRHDTPWSLADTCADLRHRWDAAGNLQSGIRQQEDIENSSLTNVDTIVLGSGLFGMDTAMNPNTGLSQVSSEYTPGSYLPQAALTRVLDWLDSGGKTLCVGAFWFGHEIGSQDSVPGTYPSRVLGYVDPVFPIPGIVPGATGSEALEDYSFFVNPSLIADTNRIYAALGIATTIDANWPTGVMTYDTPHPVHGATRSVPLAVHRGLTGITIESDWPDDVVADWPTYSTDEGYLLPMTSGGTVVATAKLRSWYHSVLSGSPLELPEMGTSNDAFDAAVLETRGTSRILIAPIHAAQY